MVYFKVLLNTKRKKEDNIYPVEIRITFNRVSTTVSTGVRINSNDWDDKKGLVKTKASNFNRLNKIILECHSNVQKVALKLEEENAFSFEELRDRLNNKPVTKKKVLNVNQFALLTIKNLFDEGKSGNALVYQAMWSRVDKYNQLKSLDFSQVDFNFIEGFRRQLLKEGVKINTISNYLRTLRALYNRAIKVGIVKSDSYPFKYIKVENEKTQKRAVAFKDLKQLLHQSGLSLNERVAVDYFFLSLSLIGISFTDLAYLKKRDIADGRIHYGRRKTGKIYNIKICEFTDILLKRYEHVPTKYLLPILKDTIIEDSLEAHKIIKQWIKTTNHYLKGLSQRLELPKITTYVARHSWATTAKRLGYSNEIIAEALGHEYGNRITSIYLDGFEQSVIDEVNEKVLECLS